MYYCLEQHCSTLPETNFPSGTNKVYQVICMQLFGGIDIMFVGIFNFQFSFFYICVRG